MNPSNTNNKRMQSDKHFLIIAEQIKKQANKLLMRDKHFIPVERLKELRYNILSSKKRMSNTADRPGMAEALLEDHIKPILDAYQPIISPLASHYADTLYRARKCIGENPFTNIKDLYNPPTASGRAFTSSTMPILYASSSMQTCLSELDPKIGDLINIVQFEYTKIMGGQFWFIGQLGLFHKSNEPSRFLGDKSSVEKPHFFPKWALHSWVFKDSLMNEIFSEVSSQLDNYVLNRFLIDEIRKKLPEEKGLNGVVFLSIKDPPGINFAIYGHSINKLEPRVVNLVRITDIDDYGFVAFHVLNSAKPKNGSLEWPDFEFDLE